MANKKYRIRKWLGGSFVMAVAGILASCGNTAISSDRAAPQEVGATTVGPRVGDYTYHVTRFSNPNRVCTAMISRYDRSPAVSCVLDEI